VCRVTKIDISIAKGELGHDIAADSNWGHRSQRNEKVGQLGVCDLMVEIPHIERSQSGNCGAVVAAIVDDNKISLSDKNPTPYSKKFEPHSVIKIIRFLRIVAMAEAKNAALFCLSVSKKIFSLSPSAPLPLVLLLPICHPQGQSTDQKDRN